MRRDTAQAYLMAAAELEDIDTRLTTLITKLEALNDEQREYDDVFDDLVYFRDSVRKTRQDMEHRIADAQEVVTFKKGKRK